MDLYLTLGQSSVWLPAVLALGLSVGVVAGMFGVGGGFLMVPLLHAVLGVPLPLAVGVGLCQAIATALGALLRYRGMGHAETRFDMMLLGGAILGVDAGTRALDLLQGSGAVWVLGNEVPILNMVIVPGYTLLFVVTAYLLWYKQGPAALGSGEPGPFTKWAIPPLVDLPNAGVAQVSGIAIGYIGFINGFLAGILGIGGGIFLIPVMLYGFGFHIQKTAGTGIVVVLVAAVIGTIQHARLGNVHLGLAMTCVMGAALAAQIGATLTKTMPAVFLRRTLAVVLLVTLALLLMKTFG